MKDVFFILCVILFFLDPFGFGFVFGYGLFVFLLLNLKTSVAFIDQSLVILILFCVVFSGFYAFDPFSGTQFIFLYMIIPPCFYLAGKILGKNWSKKNIAYRNLILLSFFFSIIALISILLNIYQEGFVQTERDVPLIWSGKTSATGSASYFFANMCIPALLLNYFRKKDFWFNSILIVVFFGSLLCVLRLGSRTQIAIMTATIIASIIYTVPKLSPGRKIGVFASLFLILNFGIGRIYLEKDSELLTSYATRIDSKSHGATTAGGRTHLWEKSIEYIFRKPLGWSIEEFGYSHNLWFDAARVGSVIAFTLLLIFTFINVKKVLAIIKDNQVNLNIRNIVLIYFLAFMLQFFVEPIMDGSFRLFAYFSFFAGFISSKYAEISKNAAK